MNYVVRALTRPAKHHFFGYYDMRPWDPTGRYHLVLEVDFSDRPPTAEDVAAICAVDLAEDGRLIRLADTRAWNFQQGAMLNFRPGTESTFVHNDRRDGKFVCVARDMRTKAERVVGPAIGALSDDGRWGATLNFARIAVTRPGYGYLGVPDRGADENLPEGDGVGLLDMDSGRHRMLVTFRDLIDRQEPELGYGAAKVWFNHTYINPSATRVAWLCRWVPPGAKSWVTQMWCVGTDGSDLVRVIDGAMVSHFDWRDDETIIAWANVGERHAMWEFDHLRRTDPRPRFLDTIHVDGHISFSPDRRWVACDTYPDAAGNRELFIVEDATERRVSLGSYYSPRPPEYPDIRCDFHPSWSDDGRRLAFDGMHEGTRQRYVVELKP